VQKTPSVFGVTDRKHAGMNMKRNENEKSKVTNEAKEVNKENQHTRELISGRNT